MEQLVADTTVKERRGAPRIGIGGCRVLVRPCRWPFWNPVGPEYAARGVDLSFTGLSLRGRRTYRPGEHVLATIQPLRDDEPTGEPLTLRARVVWCEKLRGSGRDTVGLHFASGPEPRRTHIAAWTARMKALIS